MPRCLAAPAGPRRGGGWVHAHQALPVRTTPCSSAKHLQVLLSVFSGEEVDKNKHVNTMSAGGQWSAKRVPERLVRAGSLTGRPSSREPKDIWEQACHLCEHSRKKEPQAHPPRGRRVSSLVRGQRERGECGGNEAKEAAGWPHRALQARTGIWILF